MANQVEVAKLNQLGVVGPKADNVAVSKLAMFALLIPGGGDDTSNKQGHVRSQIIVRGT